MARWVELAKTSVEDGKPVQSPSGKFIDLDRAGYVAVVQQADHNGAPIDSWVVRTDAGALVTATLTSESDARSLVADLVSLVDGVAPQPEPEPAAKTAATAARKRAGSA